MATANIVWIDNQPYAPNHPKALAQYRKDMDQYRKSSEKVEYEIATPPSLGRELKDKVAKRLRQDSKPAMNKLETEFYEVLKGRNMVNGRTIMPQAIRLKLGNGIWYKFDFFCQQVNGRCMAYEVKGPFAHRGGFENLKVAASLYQMFTFILVWKEDGQWREQIILP